MASTNPVEITIKLSDVAKGFLARNDAKDAVAIEKVNSNYKKMNQADQKKLGRLWFSFFHTLAVKVDDVDKTIDENERKGGNENKGTAPIKDQRAVAPEWKKYMGMVMKDVDKDFQTWAVLSRGIGKDLEDAAKVLYWYGMTDNKRVTKKGGFIYFSTDQEMFYWFSTMTTIGTNLMLWILGSDNLDVTTKSPIPQNKQEWVNYVNAQLDGTNNRAVVPAPSLSAVQAYFNASIKEVIATGSMSASNKVQYDMMLEVFTVIRPSRLFITKDGVRRKFIPLDISKPVMEGFQAMKDQISDAFVISAVDTQVRFPSDMNKAVAEIIKVYSNLPAQFRTIRRGGDAGRLGANESRQFVPFNFKFV